jgi:predicted Zn finger-like uncharacterized protein
MPHATLTCPHCDATLRPAKPVAEGKTVKCPKCGETFKAPMEAVSAAKPAPKAKPEPAAAAKPKDDEDGIYGVARDPEEEARKAREEEKLRRKKRKRLDDEDEDEDEEEGNDILDQYLKNLKAKDPRGPAQMAVVNPSNWLLRTGLIGFFGWVITLIVFLIPVAFPNLEKKEDVDPRTGRPIREEGDKDKKKEAPKQAVFKLEHVLQKPIFIVAFVASLVFGLVHACLICVGAVKMFNLESYGWSMTSCILALLPYHIVPIWYFLWTVLDFFELYEMSWAVALIVMLAGPIVGGLCLSVLRRPEVKEGFDYHPD